VGTSEGSLVVRAALVGITLMKYWWEGTSVSKIVGSNVGKIVGSNVGRVNK